VGAGNILKDIIASGRVTVVELNEIFRQARESRIIVNAHRINVGLTPEYSASESDFYFIEQEEPEKVVGIIIELVRERIPRKFNLDPVDDIQVLSPMHRGLIGVENLNRELQNALNPGGKGTVRGAKILKVHDKVMQIRNNYKKDVFNGDMGRIIRIEEEGRKIRVSFDGRSIDYESAELDEITLAYAVSVHKAQGSEYPAVVIPVMTQHYLLLQRNLLYTAVTRGEKLVVLVGSKKALNIAVKNDKTQKRYTLLAERLK
jgi:exodeoxyribonuclease V alpha subunit